MKSLTSFLRALIHAEIAESTDQILSEIRKERLKIMAAIDDLKTSVANLGTSISEELDAISTKLSSIPTGGPGTSDDEIEAVVAQIDSLKTKVDQETATLSGTAGTTPVPAPTPTPSV